MNCLTPDKCRVVIATADLCPVCQREWQELVQRRREELDASIDRNLAAYVSEKGKK